MTKPFIGSEALAAGVMSRGALRWNHTALHPDVYLENGARRDIDVNAYAAWLWTKRAGIITGRAAAALHGVRWIDDATPIELVARHGRRRPGIIVYEERIGPDEVSLRCDLPVATVARTALDLARHLPRDEAVVHLDALAAKTGITAEEIDELATRYAPSRGIRSARTAIALMDGGATSHHQTRLRLMVLDAGLPRPRTSILLHDNLWETVVSIGWEGPKVCLEHQDDLANQTAAQRIARDELLQRLGWHQIRALREHTRRSVVLRTRAAIRRRQ